ncbi:hypothetical protein GH714_015478 [Hevea brasiliensis]|uniref:Uncharacterized protein n=1 Tax=Hevea brasiliensis TaxID=3981 RepID=A0A6A6KP94_HEVBR|nr:hypothetical protein GH714_015478 [Hevea brasiliensis]
MGNLRELIYEAEDILADCQLESRDDSFSNGWLCCIHPPKLQFQYKTGKRLREINENITKIKQDLSYLGLSTSNGMARIDVHNDPRWSSPVYDHTQVVGLEGKRFLIVMDDVWSSDVNWWRGIFEGLPKGNGSCIIITTRIKEVAIMMGVSEARIHRPKFLSEDDGWLLFRKIAFAASGGDCRYPELEQVGKEIVSKCKGLPLAIKAIGGLLLYKSHYNEWRRIAKNFRDELAENDDSVMASLQLSYDELPTHLKSCFLSFSLYPEDCVIAKEQLVHWWIGEGFVPVRNGRSAIEAGEGCFSGLTNRCLVEVVDKTYNGIIYTCKIHDMVRDLVIKMAEDDAFFRLNGIGCRHLGLIAIWIIRNWLPIESYEHCCPQPRLVK